MQVKNTEIRFMKGDIASLTATATFVPVDNIIQAIRAEQGRYTGEAGLRRLCADVLRRADELKAKSVALPGLGGSEIGLPLGGAARIMAQEIIKYLRHEESGIKEIIFYLPDAGVRDLFEQTFSGYVAHVRDKLGEGPYATVDIIIELAEGLILVERSNPPYGLALPGGFVDYGESLETAAKREAKEETNMELVDMRQFHTYSEPQRDPRFHTISTVFIAKGAGVPCSGDDARGLKIVPYEELLNLDYAFDHKKIIADYLQPNREFR